MLLQLVGDFFCVCEELFSGLIDFHKAVLGSQEHEHYQCFMHGVAVTPHQHSEVGARSQHGRHGRLATHPFEHLHADFDHFQKIESYSMTRLVR